MNHQDALTGYVSVCVDELSLCGVRDVVISPGSRSTPLALLFSEHPKIRVYMNIDERSAGFFALGLAKAKRKPVALLCSSGTATANYYPAIIEAFYSRIPLIVLTADRPPELQNIGAPQTIDQVRMYGNHVKQFAEVDIPEHDLSLIHHTRTICARSVATAVRAPKGPVHLNFPFREPLVPDLKTARRWWQDEAPTVKVHTGLLTLSQPDRSMINKLLDQAKRGVVICGPLSSDEIGPSILSLAQQLGFPVLADPLSQLRRGPQAKIQVVESYDTFLKDRQTAAELEPDLVIRFGAMPVSKRLMLWLKTLQAEQIVIDGGQGWRDPADTATHMVHCDESLFCEEMLRVIKKRSDLSWLEQWRRVNSATKAVLMTVANDSSFGEEKLFAVLSEQLPDRSHLFAGNSMPIRELDSFFFSGEENVNVYANRGANGIDGVVSTAAGVATVKQNTVLVIGDLSFFHDMNGLLGAKQNQVNLTIVLVNNDGGGIFSFLPQASEKKHFEALYGTPHGLDFSNTARLYGCSYQKVEDEQSFVAALVHSFSVPGLKIIEVPTKRSANVDRHHELDRQVSEALRRINCGVKG